MAVDYTPVNIVLQTRADYQPLDLPLAQQRSLLAYQKGQQALQQRADDRKNTQQQLIKLQSLGLPKEMQGQINHEVDSLIQEVRDGNISPDSYDFKRRLAEINSDALLAADATTAMMGLMGKEGFVMEQDANGNPLDTKQRYDNEFLASWDKDYSPDNKDVISKYATLAQQASSGFQEGVDIDTKNLLDVAGTFIDQNADQFASLRDLPGSEMLTVEQKITTLAPKDRERLRDALLSSSSVITSLRQEYAAQNAYGGVSEPFNEYAQRRINEILPKSPKIKETVRIDKDAEQRSEKSGDLFTINRNTIADANVARTGQTVTKLRGYDVEKDGTPKLGGDAGRFMDFYEGSVGGGRGIDVITITPDAKGTSLKPIVINGVEGVLDELHVKPDGTGYAIMTVRGSETKEGITTPLTINKLVEITPSDRDKIESTYGVNIKQGEPEAEPTNPYGI